MAKIAIINDTHFGVRNDNSNFHTYFKKFYENVFFPTIDKEEIKTIIHLGDLVDRRKYIQYLTAKVLHDNFMDPVFDRDIDFHILCGNHDTQYKHTNSYNAIKSLYKNSKYDIKLYEKAETINVDGLDICLVPWICADNQNDFYLEIAGTKAQILMGHLELSGFEMDRGHIMEHGMDKNIFQKFEMVLSGHYHHKSNVGNISYLGAPCQFTWADYDDTKGFHILDTDTRELRYIENPYQVFRKFFYNDATKNKDEMLKFDESIYEGCYVKIVIKNKTINWLFDSVIAKIETANPANIQIVEDHLNLDGISEDELVDEAQDTLTILKKYVSNMDTPVDKIKLDAFIRNLYEEALNIE